MTAKKVVKLKDEYDKIRDTAVKSLEVNKVEGVLSLEYNWVTKKAQFIYEDVNRVANDTEKDLLKELEKVFADLSGKHNIKSIKYNKDDKSVEVTRR